ncbi:ATP-binding cassette subfamily B protein [Pedobacter cryoconitis]|uniref:ATP-binding cassette subfamily B protein n=2 Tax=Pedobacter cryoconitis TaxID=188932 RepID=A0A7W8ZNT4_9SPHI|nr:ATP-binding cassette subfamily B protein [Pedobacter cryoconitis]
MKNWTGIKQEGSSMLDIIDTASTLGIKSTGLEIDIKKLRLIDLPVILHWDKHHFVVLFKIQNDFYFIADPGIGILKLNELDFLCHWQNHEKVHHHSGLLLTLSIIY